MKQVNKKLIKQARDLIDAGLENCPNYYSGKGFGKFIRTDRKALNSIIRRIKNSIDKSQLFRIEQFKRIINIANYFCDSDYFKIIDIDDSKDSSTIDISSSYANLEVIYTIIIDDNDMYLTNNMAIRLRNNPDNEVWLYEDELLELY